MKTQAIVPTAGSGERMKLSTPKPLLQIDQQPIIVYTLKALEESSLVESIVLVVPGNQKDVFSNLIAQYQLSKVSKIVAGGKTRSDSVYNGLQATDDDTEIVLVHDGARPLITVDLIDKTINEAMKNKAAVVAVPVKPTIKRVSATTLMVEETLDRENLWEIQTPQVFKKDLLLNAHANKKNIPTDDAALVEELGVAVRVVQGSYKNIKITTQEDLIIAEAFLSS